MSDQKCSCAEMDWTGCDLTQPHHPDCPHKEPVRGFDAEASLRIYAPIGEAPEIEEWQVTEKGLDVGVLVDSLRAEMLGILGSQIQFPQIGGSPETATGAMILAKNAQPIKSDCQNERPRLPAPVLLVEGEPGSGPWNGTVSIRVVEPEDVTGSRRSDVSRLALAKKQNLLVEWYVPMDWKGGDVIFEMTLPGFAVHGPWMQRFKKTVPASKAGLVVDTAVPYPNDEKSWLKPLQHVGLYGRHDHRDVGSVGPWFKVMQAIERGQEGGVLESPKEGRYVAAEQETCPFVHAALKCTLVLGHGMPHGGEDGSQWEPVDVDAKPHVVITQDACWNVVSQAFMEEVYLRVRGAAAEYEHVTVVFRNVQAKDFPRLIVDYGDLIHRVLSNIKEGNGFALARQTMAECFRREPEPGGIRDSYVSNIAMLLYDNQQMLTAECLETKEGRDAIAERIMKLIFEG